MAGEAKTLLDRRRQVGLGIYLTAVAGYVDAIGFIALGGLFASFMSGASIGAGVAATGSQWAAVLEACRLIGVFLAGVVAATVTAGLAGIWTLPATLALEGALLGGAGLLDAWDWDTRIAILPVVAAMGVQNTILAPVDGARLGATFMTGTLVGLGQGIGRLVLARRDQPSFLPHALLWCGFVAGAAGGALLYGIWRFAAVWVAAALVGAAALPLAVLVLLRRRRP